MFLQDALWQDQQRMSGAVCFRGTRIPVSILFDYLEADKLHEFYQQYPDVSPNMVFAVLAASRQLVEDEFPTKRSA